jgi:hypothetical protein
MSKAAELAALIGSQSSLSNRNLIINGAMTVNQRGDKTGMTGDDYQIDRFKFGIGSLGTWSSSQSTTAPDGFGYSLKLDCTTADASPAASDTLYLYTRFEGQNLQQIKKGTASAESLTLSFWCRCNKTGDIQVNLRDANNTRQVGATVTINSADTWEYKTITFPPDTTGAFTNDNNWSMNVEWWLDSGSDFKGGAVPTAWEAAVNTDRAVAETLALGDSTSNTFYITGVQLEVGEQATPFEHRSYGDELARCQRYYETGSVLKRICTGNGESDHDIQMTVTKRADPTFTISNQTNVTNNAATNFSTTAVGINGSASAYTNFSYDWTADAEL